MKNPKVSIIIPCYNSEKTLIECLNSVLNQTYKNYEIIVVDNNSTDNTKKIIKQNQEKSRKIKYLFEPKIGRGSARNTGEKNAKGEIILMTDSDCIVPKNWIKEMIEPIINKECDAVQGFEENINKDFWSKQYQLRAVKKYKSVKNIKGKEILGKIDTKNFAIKRKLLENIGLTSKKQVSANDAELGVRMAKNNFNVKFLKNTKVKHYHRNSLKQVIKKQLCNAEHSIRLVREHKDFLKKTGMIESLNQTPYSFIGFFPGLIGTISKESFSYALYEFITGFFWRVGIVIGLLK